MRKFLKAIAAHWARKHDAGLCRNIAILLGDETLTLADVGAAGGLESRWRPIAPFLNVVAFEPDERSGNCLADKLSACASVTVHPYGLWDHNGLLSLNLCRSPEVSSHFTPNAEFLNRFSNADRIDILETCEIPVRMLDDINLGVCDFIKLDIQGAELAALTGAQRTLKGAFGVQCEVQFIELYHGEPLFGDIAKFMAGQGFEFVDFTFLSREDRQTGVSNFGNLTFADALFLRAPDDFEYTTFSDLRRYAAILLIYQRYDMLKVLARRCGKNFPELAAQIEKIAERSDRAWKNRRRLFSAFNFLARFTGHDSRAFPLY